MADVFSRAKRSEIMSRVRGRENAATELKLIALFRSAKISGWRRRSAIFGSPDFVFPRKKVAIFVDGCFWHCCPIHGTVPASNRAFWQAKLQRNVQRDRVVVRRLRALGWRVIRIWQHDLRDQKKALNRVTRALALGPGVRRRGSE